MKTFELLIGKNGEPTIKCLVCGRVSYNTNDIKQEFCGCCKKYHSELAYQKEPEPTYKYVKVKVFTKFVKNAIFSWIFVLVGVSLLLVASDVWTQTVTKTPRFNLLMGLIFVSSVMLAKRGFDKLNEEIKK